MNKEKLRQEHNRELEEKEQEMEDMRASSQKKVIFMIDTKDDDVLFIINSLVPFRPYD